MFSSCSRFQHVIESVQVLPELVKVLQDVLWVPRVGDGPTHLVIHLRLLQEQSQRLVWSTASISTKCTVPGQVMELGGRVGGREEGREGGREGGRERGREEGKEGGREDGRVGGRE